MSVRPTTAHRVTHGGREVLFCSARCKDRFVAEP
jgi:YHS domain-containing protein